MICLECGVEVPVGSNLTCECQEVKIQCKQCLYDGTVASKTKCDICGFKLHNNDIKLTRKCGKCTYENDMTVHNCSICDHPLELKAKQCPNCTLENRENDNECNVCHFKFIEGVISPDTSFSFVRTSNIELSPRKTTAPEVITIPESPNISTGKNCQKCTVINPIDAVDCKVCGSSMIPQLIPNVIGKSGKPKKIPTCYKCGQPGHYSPQCDMIQKSIAENTLTVPKVDKIEFRDKHLTSDSAVDGIIPLLSTRLLADRSITFALCSPLSHVTQIGREGHNWSCGYRNIQMLCSALMRRSEYQQALFDGAGSIPDIHGLQSWLQRAWQSGFDTEGAEQFEHRILGTKHWIGATECAALLRSFRIPAKIVDFRSTPGSSETIDSRLEQWVKRYFTTHRNQRQSDGFVSPLYFQHQGHSRTIIGYIDEPLVKETQSRIIAPDNQPRIDSWIIDDDFEVKEIKEPPLKKIKVEKKSKYQDQGSIGEKSGFNMLIFDPSSKGSTVLESLDSGNSKWKSMLKRGLHTFKKKEYQIVYIASGEGLMSDAETERSKVLVGVSDSENINI